MFSKSLIAMVTKRTTGERAFFRMDDGVFDLVGVQMEEDWIQKFKVATRIRTYEGQSLL